MSQSAKVSDSLKCQKYGFLSVVNIHLKLFHCIGLNYSNFDENGKESFSTKSILFALTAATIVFSFATIFYVNCPFKVQTFVEIVAGTFQHSLYIFYIATSILWFWCNNKELVDIVKKILIVDDIIIDKLKYQIDYQRARLKNYVRAFVLVLLYISIVVLEIIFIFIAESNIYTYECSLIYLSGHFVDGIVDLLLFMFMHELKMRLHILIEYLNNNELNTQGLQDVHVVYTLMLKISKKVNRLFQFHIIIKLLYMFVSSLYFTFFLINFKSSGMWNLIVNMTTYVYSMVINYCEVWLFVYSFDPFKTLVSGLL